MHRRLPKLVLIATTMALIGPSAGRAESLEAELGEARASLQAGEFRKAIALANLVAGEHQDSTEALALLALMEDRVGRTEHALSMLSEARAQKPDDPDLLAATAQILIDRLAPERALEFLTAHPSLAANLVRLRERAKFAIQPIAKPSIAAGNGVVIDSGREVLTHARLLTGHVQTIEVRNGLGEIHRASITPDKRAGDLVLLRLEQPYPANSSIALDDSASAIGTRFCFVLGFAAAGDPDKSYPIVAPGIVLRADAGVPNLMQITSPLGPNHSGSPVFDSKGHLMGIAVGSGDSIGGASDVRARLGHGDFALRLEGLTPPRADAAQSSARGPSQHSNPSVEELYERLLPAVVQVIVR